MTDTKTPSQRQGQSPAWTAPELRRIGTIRDIARNRSNPWKQASDDKFS